MMTALLKTIGPRAMIVLRMSLYGMAISTLGGFMYGLGFLEHIAPIDPSWDDYLAQFAFAAFFGGGIGFCYGFLAAPVLGYMIALLALIFFREMTYPRLFRAAAATITAAGIYLVSPLDVVSWSLATVLNNNFVQSPEAVAVLVLYVLAIYLSQIVARKYIQEIPSEGRKVKAR
ncbi:MAG: hypothetical protein OXG39_18195 [Chloroflexi bacterium]|nr:hypothetical protein [Chloroflexota bacterium]